MFNIEALEQQNQPSITLGTAIAISAGGLLVGGTAEYLINR